MNRNRSIVCTGLALTLSALVAACAPAAPVAKVTFVDLANDATVSSPMVVKMAAENFTVEPAGEVTLRIGYPSPCRAAGTGSPAASRELTCNALARSGVSARLRSVS